MTGAPPARKDGAPSCNRNDDLGGACAPAFDLLRHDIRRLLTLRALRDVKRYLLTFLQAFEARRIDRREMREKVLTAVIRGNEAEALCVVEPLNSTSSHDLES